MTGTAIGIRRAQRKPSRNRWFAVNFALTGKLHRRWPTSALGFYELRLNGERVGDLLSQPEFTEYPRHVQYQTYDVTKLLKPGANAVAALLGDGYYAGRVGLPQVFVGRLRTPLRTDSPFPSATGGRVSRRSA